MCACVNVVDNSIYFSVGCLTARCALLAGECKCVDH